MSKIKWKKVPDEHDYPAAADYLSLSLRWEKVLSIRQKLEEAQMTMFKAKDIIRASGLPLLPVRDPHVEANLAKIKAKVPLSPILLVRTGSRVIVADGFHRVCSVYHYDYDAEVPAKIVSL